MINTLDIKNCKLKTRAPAINHKTIAIISAVISLLQVNKVYELTQNTIKFVSVVSIIYAICILLLIVAFKLLILVINPHKIEIHGTDVTLYYLFSKKTITAGGIEVKTTNEFSKPTSLILIGIANTNSGIILAVKGEYSVLENQNRQKDI